MDTRKRKRDDDREKDGKRTNGNEVNGRPTVKDDEVDEFFAIVKRIKVAVKYFEKSNGGRRKLTEKEWRTSFEVEDSGGDNNVNFGRGKTEEAVEEISEFDLNSDPQK